MTLDKAEIAKMKVAELKAELENRSIEVPKGREINLKLSLHFNQGAKKADLVALLEKQLDGSSGNGAAAEHEDSNDVADEIEKISAEDDLAADLEAPEEEDDEPEKESDDVKQEAMSQQDEVDVHAGDDPDLIAKDVKQEESDKDVEPKVPKGLSHKCRMLKTYCPNLNRRR